MGLLLCTALKKGEQAKRPFKLTLWQVMITGNTIHTMKPKRAQAAWEGGAYRYSTHHDAAREHDDEKNDNLLAEECTQHRLNLRM